jgi:hypothetical protein
MTREKCSFARLLLLLPLIGLVATAAVAEDLVYEFQDKPLFSMVVPEGWATDLDFAQEALEAGIPEGEEPRFEVVEIAPGDGSHVWFGVWALPDISTLDEGLAYLVTLGGDLFADLETSEPKVTELQGMAARTIRGTGVYNDEDVEVALALFTPREGAVVAVLYAGAPGAWKEHAEALSGMVASLKPAS